MITLNLENSITLRMIENDYINIKGFRPENIYKEINIGEILKNTKPLTPKRLFNKYFKPDSGILVNVLNGESVINDETALSYIFSILRFNHDSQFKIKSNFPFKWIDAPDSVNDALRWVDSYIKIQIEKASAEGIIKPWQIKHHVELALRLWADIVMMDITPNQNLLMTMDLPTSMLLHKIVVALSLGKQLVLSSESEELLMQRNRIYLEVLKQNKSLNYKNDNDMIYLLKMSLCSGVIWPDQGNLLDRNILLASYYINDKIINANNLELRIDHLSKVLDSFAVAKSVVFILDDNGESVFDIAFAQLMLQKFPELSITFLLNQFTVDINISVTHFNHIISDLYFKKIKHLIQSERVKVLTQQIVYDSFQLALLTDEGLSAVENSDFCYVKGQNNFESFSTEKSDNFYLFQSSSRYNTFLTGTNKLEAVTVFIKKNQERFHINSNNTIIPLTELLSGFNDKI